jgi:hypothetical protein
MTYITPDVDIRNEGGFHFKRNGKWERGNSGPFFTEPYPLSDKFFLVSSNPDKKWNDTKAYGLYLIDEFGNRILLYKDPEISSWQPYPIRPRRRPPVVPSILPTQTSPPREATIMMSDVYVGLKDIPRGTIKYLRVMEQIPRPWGARRFWGGDSYDQQHAVITKDTHLALKVMHGVVPIEEDGSAYFLVPAERNIFFQALDEDFMEIQRMRTYINLRQGETRSCIGCHELRQLAPGNKKSIAFQNPPRRPEAQPGDVAPRPIHYAKDVQPILDKHCVTCHNSSDPKADLDLSGEMTTLFNRSYESILDRKLVKTIGENHPKTGNVGSKRDVPETKGNFPARNLSSL